MCSYERNLNATFMETDIIKICKMLMLPPRQAEGAIITRVYNYYLL